MHIFRQSGITQPRQLVNHRTTRSLINSKPVYFSNSANNIVKGTTGSSIHNPQSVSVVPHSKVFEINSIVLNQNKFKFELIPINDNDYLKIKKYTVPVSYQAPYPDKHALSKWYIGLTHLFGKSSKVYDDYKGAFAFCTRMELIDDFGEKYHYLCRFSNYRSWIEIDVYKFMPENEISDRNEPYRAYRSPFPEFPQELYNIFYNYMFAFCDGYSSTAPKSDFVMKVQSNHIIFGFLNNEFIELHIPDPDEFESTWQKMRIKE